MTPDRFLVISVGVILLGSLPAAGQALLQDDNAAVFVDAVLPGVSTWTVDDEGRLFQRWFWYRIGDSGPEIPLETQPLLFFLTFDSNPDDDPRDDSVAMHFGDPNGLNFELNFVLRGGSAGSGRSTLDEQIIISNDGATTLQMHFYQYADFDIGNSGDDTAQIVGGSTAQQWDSTSFIEEIAVIPPPSHFDVAPHPDLFNLLTDMHSTTLDDVPGPLGPGDLTFAFQWNRVLVPGESLLIRTDTSIVPAAGSLYFFAVAMIVASRRR